jgi:hypothetical protein
MPGSLDHPFNDYVPKMTADDLRDFMPGILPIVDDLPETKLDNLHLLVGLFKDYRKSAKKNPGVWKEGNLVLGAKEEEYHPSEDELLLAEVGERIRQIATEEGSQQVKATLKEHQAKKRKFKYKRFTFIHMDVMGSGRFFYVESIENVNLKLY